MGPSTPWIGIISYASGALLYGATAAILAASHPGGRRATMLVGATAASAFWAGGLFLMLPGAPPPLLATLAFDGAHLLIWTACVLAWVPPASARYPILLASGAAGGWTLLAAGPGAQVFGVESTSSAGLVLMALLGLLAVEQVYRNAEPETRRHVRWFCLAAAGIFAIDLVVYSHATLFGGSETILWHARGFANAGLLPLIVLAVKRQHEWERELFVSRQVVFHTATFLGVGTCLLAIGLVAYAMRSIGGEWTSPADLVFIAASATMLLAGFFSANLRARAKVFLVKHFYRNKYDYREEWLRLTETLARADDLVGSALNGLEGMARIIGTGQGELWLDRDEQRYEWLVSLGRDGSPSVAHYDKNHPLVTFLASTGWVVDTDEYAREPHRYGMAFGDPADNMLPPSALVVPLDRQGYLQGFVVLAKPSVLGTLNFEDRDILKTAGRQVAAVLAQALAQERLTETRQFEAMNRLSAFLMHDLKNIVAQQELMIANAPRFRHRPEFIDDTFATIRSCTERMKRVLEQLRGASKAGPARGRVDVSKVLMEVRSVCSDREPVPQIEWNGQGVWAWMDRDELASVLLHLLRNAQDATPPSGSIKVALANEGDNVLVTITDTGCGMDAAFVRDRLFRPFDTTKGAKGMGIGAYQARHILRLAGGDLDVTSEPGVGTTFRLRLPSAA